MEPQIFNYDVYIWVIFQRKSGVMNKIDHGTAGTASRTKSDNDKA